MRLSIMCGTAAYSKLVDRFQNKIAIQPVVG